MDFNDYVSRGIAFFQKNEIEPALENLKAALELKPDNSEIREFVRMAEQMNSAKMQASQHLENEAKQRAETMGIKIEDIDRVITEYTEALNHSPNDASAKNSLANAYYIRGLTFTSRRDNARAIADYSEAIKYQPDYLLAFDKRGQSYLGNGDFDSAIADFEELKRFNHDNNKVDSLLAGAYMKRGIEYDKKKDYARAISDFENVLQFKPDDNTARELLEMAKAEVAKR
jgi:tetratricopeptide (TPR) repeat protein